MLLALVLLPFLMAICLPLLYKIAGKHIGWFALPVPVIIFVGYISNLQTIMSGESVSFVMSWVDSLGIDLAFRLDGLSLIFALLISGIGAFVIFYSIFYLSSKERLGHFYTFLMIFLGAMLGVVTCDNLILLYLFWEITSVSSFLLIGFWWEKKKSRDGALKAFLLTVTGGFALLAAFILVGNIAGTFSLSTILADSTVIRESEYFTVILILVLLGAFTKSAQVPFHIWLPTAMEAPTPISCYLHSATMVKAGIFLIARFTPILGGVALWNGTITIVGLASLLFGSFMALRQKDLKGLLAYSTISQLGLIVCLFGIGTEAAIIAGLFHLLNHSMFKGSLFLMTGIVDHEAGTRDMTILRGLGKVMPFTALVAFIGSLSMAGLPPFSGFLSKELFFESAYEAATGLEFLGDAAILIPIIAVIASLFTFVYSISIFGKVFMGKEVGAASDHVHEAPKGLLAPALILVSFNIIIALFPSTIANTLVAPAALAVSGVLTDIHISFWHGITPALLMTFVVVGLGAILYANLDRFKAFIMKYSFNHGSEALYQKSIPTLFGVTGKITNSHMTGSLRQYTIMILIATIFFVSLPLAKYGLFTAVSFDDLAPVGIIEVILIVIAAVAAIVTAVSPNRVWAILSLGVVGSVVAVLFVVFGAPDLALTQLLVESATLVLYLLVLKYLPPSMEADPRPKQPKKSVTITISVIVGAFIGFLSYFSHSNRLFESISWYYLENSKLLGGGDNVVNVTLVDFRGLDTMGEISVLAIAAMGCLALINLIPKGRKEKSLRDIPDITSPNIPGGFNRKPDAEKIRVNDVVMVTTVRAIAYVIILMAIYLFLAGHNAPGGGFIAGLMVSGAMILLYVTLGKGFVGKIRLNFKQLIPVGLCFVLAQGLGGVILGYPFLTHTFGHFHIPFFGDIELATAMIFDFGVFLVVIGTVMSIIIAIGKGQR